MSSLKMYGVLALLAVLVAVNALPQTDEEEFAFDTASDDFKLEISEDSRKPLERQEIVAVVGKTFRFVVPKRVFGNWTTQRYEAKRHGSRGLPSWLLFDKIDGTFLGVPLAEDLGVLHISVRAAIENSPIKEYTIKVLETLESENSNNQCPPNEDLTVLTLLIDRNVRAIKPKQRVIAVSNIAKFFGLPNSAFTLKPQVEIDDITDSSVVLAGPGNIKSRSSKATSLLEVPVGCDGRLWMNTAPLVHQLKQQARDGTISEVLRLPLIGWRVKTETIPIVRSKRQATDFVGSGDYDDEEEEEYYDDYDYDDPSNPTKPSTVTASTKPTTIATSTHPHRHHHGQAKITEELDSSITIPITSITIETTPVAATKPFTTSSSTTSTTSTSTTQKATTTQATIPATKSEDNYEYNYESYDEDNEDDNDVEDGITIVPSVKQTLPESKQTFTTVEEIDPIVMETSTIPIPIKPIIPETIPTTSTTTIPVTNATSTTTTSTTTVAPDTTTMQFIEDSEPPVVFTTITQNTPTSVSTEPPPSSTPSTSTSLPSSSTSSQPITLPAATTIVTTISSTTVEELPETTEFMETTIIFTQPSTEAAEATSQKPVTTIRDITETIDYEEKNFKPYIENRLQQMSVIAGKVFRFVIPQNTFKDSEDGYNLSLQFLDANERPIVKDSWVQFNPSRREIYGLPLEEDVSKWVYYVRAVDKEGAYEQDKLTIQVQQHKLERVMNHEFTLQIRIEKQQEYPHYVDWSLKVLNALGTVFNTNISEITVRHINHTTEPVTFTWSNDLIPTSFCSKSDIEKNFEVLTANKQGDPSRVLNLNLSPEMRVKKVQYREYGVCEKPQTAVTPPMNFSPILRNPVDHVNATVGELLVYKVKDDTFYDPEDVDPRALNISLLTADRQAIPPTNWLQFDSKNREFYGIPRKAGRSEYQLVCVDSGGLPATDSLEVVVYPPTKRHYNVEFSMAIEIQYETFINSASTQKKFVEKLRDLFGDQNTSNIYLHPFKQKHDSTIVTWFNKTLSTDRCPFEEISRLEEVMNNMKDRSISSRVHRFMEPEFLVSTIKIHLINNCKPKTPHLPPPIDFPPPVEDSSSKASSDEYMITFIVPIITISIMLVIASIAACYLYRKRRSGKMNVEEDGRQSYGNKGIPVIFQEELEEKPEPGTKTPVILKDEKPPLAPPEYSKSGSVKLTDDSEPYQPPPPFTRSTHDNGKQSRPKPTPTYRKPPPYVPP